MVQKAVTECKTPHVTPQFTPQVERLLGTLAGDLSRDQLQRPLDCKPQVVPEALSCTALAAGLIEMTIPESRTAGCRNTGWLTWAGRGCHKEVSCRQAWVDAVGRGRLGRLLESFVVIASGGEEKNYRIIWSGLAANLNS